METELHNKKN